jgi:hypothetical protein
VEQVDRAQAQELGMCVAEHPRGGRVGVEDVARDAFGQHDGVAAGLEDHAKGAVA